MPEGIYEDKSTEIGRVTVRMVKRYDVYPEGGVSHYGRVTVAWKVKEGSELRQQWQGHPAFAADVYAATVRMVEDKCGVLAMERFLNRATDVIANAINKAV